MPIRARSYTGGRKRQLIRRQGLLCPVRCMDRRAALASRPIMMKPRGHRTGRTFLVGFLLICFAQVAGCQLAGRGGAGPGVTLTHSDRLIAAYPELRSGRFVVIADFEDPVHMELFQLINVSDRAACTLGQNKGRPETGGHGLRFRAGSTADTLVLRSDRATNWYMKRDWRPYDLLLASVHAPTKDLSLRLLIGAGPPDERLAVESVIRLDLGWNLLRLDLAEIGEHIPTDDVREIRLSLDGAATPTTVYLDDILLTGHCVDLLGDATNTDGELYVRQVGRRWQIGAGGRFEIAFCNGQIVAWYNVRSDPYRLRNLVSGTVLGPTPVVVAVEDRDSDSEISDFSVLGKTVQASQRITEMSPVRVVVECEWRFVDSPEDDPADRPYQHWQYTIYPTGQIYVAVQSVAETATWSPPQLGLAVSISSLYPYEWRVHPAAQLGVPEPLRHVVFGSARGQVSDGAFLLFAMSDSQATPRIMRQLDAPHDRLALIATGPKPAGATQRWTCLLMLATSGDVSESEVTARVLDYGQPVPLDLEIGAAPGDGSAPAGAEFDPATGCHTLSPERGQVRFKLSGDRTPRFSPVFRILGVAGYDAWVYVNHVIFDSIAYDADGNLIFQIPGISEAPTTVEVILRRSGVPDEPGA
jgi:hypothetical protein